MPLLDHFRPPLSPTRHWESFHANWAGAIADALNDQLLPPGYFAEETVHFGARVEIDVATFREEPSGGGTATAPVQVWAPPLPAASLPAAFPDTIEVLVQSDEGGAKLVAAVELVSPANKDRERTRRAFAAKCAGYLASGVSLIVIDIVTSRTANLHHDLLDLLGHGPPGRLPAGVNLYAVAYQPLSDGDNGRIDVWPHALEVGRELPTLPLALDAETRLPLELEATYQVACQRRRLG